VGGRKVRPLEVLCFNKAGTNDTHNTWPTHCVFREKKQRTKEYPDPDNVTNRKKDEHFGDRL